MKDKLIDKTTEIRNLLKNDDVSGSRMHNFDTFENNLHLFPADGFSDANRNEVLNLLGQAKRLELDFENAHPRLSSTFKEIVRMLSDIGI